MRRPMPPTPQQPPEPPAPAPVTEAFKKQMAALGSPLDEQNVLFSGKPLVEQKCEGDEDEKAEKEKAEKEKAAKEKEEKEKEEAKVPTFSPKTLTEDDVKALVPELHERVMRVAAKTGKRLQALKKRRRVAKRGGEKSKAKIRKRKWLKTGAAKRFKKRETAATKRMEKSGRKLGPRQRLTFARKPKKEDVGSDLRGKLMDRFGTDLEVRTSTDLDVLGKGALVAAIAAERFEAYEYEDDSLTAAQVADQIISEIEKHEKEGTMPSEEDFSNMIESVAIVMGVIEEKVPLPFTI